MEPNLYPVPGDAAIAAADLYAEYEKVKAVLRPLLPDEALGEDPRFVLACEVCGFVFHNDETVEDMGAHTKEHHPEHIVLDDDGDVRGGIRLNLVYVQPGLPPKQEGK